MGTSEHIRHDLERLVARGAELRGEIDQICEDLEAVGATETQDPVEWIGTSPTNVAG